MSEKGKEIEKEKEKKNCERVGVGPFRKVRIF
jgi:hypothetical protein